MATISAEISHFNIILGRVLGTALSLNHLLINRHADDHTKTLFDPLRKSWNDLIYQELSYVYSKHGRLLAWNLSKSWTSIYKSTAKWLEFKAAHYGGRYIIRSMIQDEVRTLNSEHPIPILQLEIIITEAYTQMAQFDSYYYIYCPASRPEAIDRNPTIYKRNRNELELLHFMVGVPTSHHNPIWQFLKKAWSAALPGILLAIGASAAVACSHAHPDHVLPIVGTAISWPQDDGKNSVEKTKQSERAFFELVKRITLDQTTLLPIPLRQTIQRLELCIASLIEHGNITTWLTLLRRRCLILSLPASQNERKELMRYREPQFCTAEENRYFREMDQRIKTLLNEYPLVRGEIKVLIDNIRNNSSSAKPYCVQAYLSGPGGVGKTRLVKTLAEALDLPLYEVKGKSITAVERLCNAFDDVKESDWQDALKTDETLLSTLGWAIVQRGLSNPIVFIDEVQSLLDPCTNSPTVYMVSDQLKGFLNCGKTRELDLGLLIPGYKMDLSRITIIMAGNKSLAEMDTALSSRFSEISFDRLNVERKEMILRQQLQAFEPTVYLRNNLRIKTRVESIIVPLVNASETFRIEGVRELETALHSICVASQNLETSEDVAEMQEADIFESFQNSVITIVGQDMTKHQLGIEISKANIRQLLFPPPPVIAVDDNQEDVLFIAQEEVNNRVAAQEIDVESIASSISEDSISLSKLLPALLLLLLSFIVAIIL